MSFYYSENLKKKSSMHPKPSPKYNFFMNMIFCKIIFEQWFVALQSLSIFIYTTRN
ncbi:hypothetical protein RchiOBHm_Chr5g0079261 [Rosa chinensis]|uniref:Uncharacterized protein n=1 Tax=Rosa chinensis TaxID=74649 RepID=A0A2P6QMH6_ROSCH|nr:hypothetical protein RchiOBHm_Chr5g0079261 [Rosa chinensis]